MVTNINVDRLYRASCCGSYYPDDGTYLELKTVLPRLPQSNNRSMIVSVLNESPLSQLKTIGSILASKYMNGANLHHFGRIPDTKITAEDARLLKKHEREVYNKYQDHFWYLRFSNCGNLAVGWQKLATTASGYTV